MAVNSTPSPPAGRRRGSRTPLWLAVLAAAVSALALASAGPGPTANAAQAQQRDAVTFEVASFNLLGSQHTAGSPSWDAGKVRARRAKRWLAAEGTSVVGLQEGQVDQLRALTRSGEWTSYPDPRQSHNAQTAQSVAWLSAEWTLVEARTFTIPFDHTQTREQPMVLLRHQRTGRRVWVITMHMTVGAGERAVQERRVGTRRLVRHVRELEATGVPVIVTGDMNDRETFFCRVAGRTTLRSPVGGGFDGSCSLPPAMRIDWIFGTPAVQWWDFRYADDEVLDRTTDHVVPVATATLGGAGEVPTPTPDEEHVVETVVDAGSEESDERDEDGGKGGEHDNGHGNGHGWGRDR